MAWVTGDFVPAPSDIIRSVLASMVGEYTANMMWDADWAADWSQDDSWSTRESNQWVTIAALRGAYGAFDIGIPFTDASINLLDVPGMILASGGAEILPGDNGGYDNVMSKPLQIHHIASPKSALKGKFEKIFKTAGMSMEDGANKVTIRHSGRHNAQYHKYVLKRLEVATDGLTGKAAEKALKGELDRLGKFIEKNPHFMYNSSGRKRTGWDNMRKYVVRGTRGSYDYRGPRR